MELVAPTRADSHSPPPPPRPARQRVEAGFLQRFGEPAPYLARAPGRVNLIGEHLDYNEGFVFPMAIERATFVALRPRRDRSVKVEALDVGETAAFHLEALDAARSGWVGYVAGVAWAMQQAGLELGGWEGVLAGDLPRGAGLSSSASLELAVARAFAAVSGIPWSPLSMALMAQRAESEWVGMNCGVMDQFVSALGQAGHACLIDTRSLEFWHAPLSDMARIVVLDTGTTRELVSSAFNERRAECERAASVLRVRALRDTSIEDLERARHELGDRVFRRARHVVTEVARTLAAEAAMRTEALVRFGNLMNESHVSLRYDFEVSSPVLDTMVRHAQAHPGCLGARMTGAGFAGCALALVKAECVPEFTRDVTQRFDQETGLYSRAFVTSPASGASLEGPRS